MAKLKSFMITGLCDYDGTNPEYNDKHSIDLVFTNVEYVDNSITADVTQIDHYIGRDEPLVQSTTYPAMLITGAIK